VLELVKDIPAAPGQEASINEQMSAGQEK